MRLHRGVARWLLDRSLLSSLAQMPGREREQALREVRRLQRPVFWLATVPEPGDAHTDLQQSSAWCELQQIKDPTRRLAVWAPGFDPIAQAR